MIYYYIGTSVKTIALYLYCVLLCGTSIIQPLSICGVDITVVLIYKYLGVHLHKKLDYRLFYNTQTIPFSLLELLKFIFSYFNPYSSVFLYLQYLSAAF